MNDPRNTKPIGKHVLLEMQPETLKSDGGLLLLSSPLRQSNIGKVLAKGPHAKCDAQVGDHVFIDLTCLALDIVEDKLRMMPAEGILAILDPK